MNLPNASNVEMTPYHARSRRKFVAKGDQEFIAWDGEGITPTGEYRQNFVLFGNSKGFRVVANRLSTDECLKVIIDTERHFPTAIHVGFAFGYDTEMILADLEIRHLHVLKSRGHVRWRGYRIEYRKGKWLQITWKTKDECVTARIWDVWSFFGTSFIAAVEEYLGDTPELLKIKAGKASRGDFSYGDLDSHIIPYWETELVLTVKLMNSLRERLYGADLKIRQWHGPGAISTYSMRNRSVGSSMSRDIPPDVAVASQHAYAGGRFELFKIGWHKGPVYAYDIRSAYPSAIAELPNLANGEWRHIEYPTEIARFGVYRLRFRSPELFSARPMPYFYRDDRYAIHYPNVVEGWYWSPEANIARYLGKDVEILEGWIFDHDPDDKPLAWIREIYATRAEWKRAGNPSQIALKLLMNSMYGKFAQRVGWERFNGPPRWHQLEWAGYITSRTRAILFRAMAEAYSQDGLLGVETDGIFSTVPLSLNIGENLGDWELSTYDSMLYLQSGFYFKRDSEKWSSKYRGFDRGSVTVEDAISALEKWKPWENGPSRRGSLLGTTTRFATMGTYLRLPNPEAWRNVWVTAPRDLNLGIDGKRVHRPMFCQQCADKVSPADAAHTLTIFTPIGGNSIPHSLPWVGKDQNSFREDGLDLIPPMQRTGS